MNIMVQIFKETLLTSLILFLMTACSDDKKRTENHRRAYFLPF